MGIVTSHSEVETYRLCSRRHWYAFGKKGGLQRRKMSLSLKRGILGHSGLATFFKKYKETKNWAEAHNSVIGFYASKVSEATDDPLEHIKLVDELIALTNKFLNTQRYRLEGVSVYGVEETIKIPVDDDLTYAFTVDLLTRDGAFFKPWDWKFPYNFYTREVIAVLPQVVLYISGLQRIGMPSRQGEYGFLRYRKPAKDAQPGDAFKFEVVDPGQKRIQATFDEWIKTAHEIARLKDPNMDPELWWEPQVKRTGNALVCKSCSFLELCGAELVGANTELMIQMDYERNTYGYGNSDD